MRPVVDRGVVEDARAAVGVAQAGALVQREGYQRARDVQTTVRSEVAPVWLVPELVGWPVQITGANVRYPLCASGKRTGSKPPFRVILPVNEETIGTPNTR